MLYRSTHCYCRVGTRLYYLSNNPSFVGIAEYGSTTLNRGENF
jgi:hypothetical protein